jgi:hypothetical protein
MTNKKERPMYLTAKDVAEILQVSNGKAYAILHDPRCVTSDIGGSIRVSELNFYRFLKACEGMSESVTSKEKIEIEGSCALETWKW